MQSIHDHNSIGNPTNEASGDTEPPTSRTVACDVEPPAPSSLLAVRADGALLMSLEDAADRDLTGRELATFLVLNEQESATARARVAGAAGETAAHLIADLPKRKP